MKMSPMFSTVLPTNDPPELIAVRNRSPSVDAESIAELGTVVYSGARIDDRSPADRFEFLRSRDAIADDVAAAFRTPVADARLRCTRLLGPSRN